MTSMVRVLTGVVIAQLLAAPVGAQETIELKASTFVPPTQWFVTDGLKPWATEVAKLTGNKVQIRVFAGNSPFGNVADQADQVAAGVTDIAWGLNGVPAGRYPRTSIMELPLVATTAKGAAKTLWSMHETYLAPDFKDFKLLNLNCTNAVGFALRNKVVHKLEELKGLRIRTANNQIQAVMQHIGAVPVTMGPGQIYESLEKGTLDGATTIYDGVRGFHLENVIKGFFDAKISQICFHVVMNKKKYQSLPSDARKIIDETTAKWIDTFPISWDKADELGHDLIKAKAIPEVHASAADRAEWRKQLKPVIDAQITAIEKQGVPNAREIYEEMVKRAAQYDR